MDDRREHRRLSVRLPLECSREGGRDGATLRACTANISTGGVYFELDLPLDAPDPAPQSLIDVDVTVPPGDGHFPYEGRIHSTAEILRCDPLQLILESDGVASFRRIGVAARFREPLKLAF